MRVLKSIHISFMSWKSAVVVIYLHMSEEEESLRKTSPNSSSDKSSRAFITSTPKVSCIEISSLIIFCLLLRVMSRYVILVLVRLYRIRIKCRLSNVALQHI